MCKSVRGAAYFGSSIHLAFSFVFLFWFIFDTLISEININLWKCDPPEQKFSEVNPLAHYMNILFKLLYFTGLSITGVYIFRGVERERPQLLKFATLAFVIIQVIGIILFSVFFSIQWNADPDGDVSSSPTALATIEAARLVGNDPGELPAVHPESTTSQKISDLNETKCNNMMALIVSEKNENNLNDADDDGEKDSIVNAITPVVSENENVLPAPDIKDETTTTTTPMPPPLPPKIEDLQTTTTLAPANITVIPAAPPLSPVNPACTTHDCINSVSPGKPQARKLPHNQLVKLVLQMCFAVFNGLFSVAYVIVLALYMLKL